MTDPIVHGEPPPSGKGKAPHRPVGKGHIDEEHRRESRSGAAPDSFPNAKHAEIPPNARTEHDQPPGGFRKGVPGRITFAEDEDDG